MTMLTAMRRNAAMLAASMLAAFLPANALAFADDPRDIARGWVIPDEGYCDQPYVVVTNQGHWLCTLTTGSGVEGQAGQHVAATISTDRGRTWGPLIDIEPAGGPEASWVMPLVVPASGRIYAFYTYNIDNLRVVPAANHPGAAKRVDTLGAYVFKFSDDGGKSWSPQRYSIPMRPMRIDRENGTDAKTLLFWGVGDPIVDRGSMFLGFSKVGKWGVPGTLVRSQGCVLRSDNILTEPDPAKVAFTLLPDGDEGLRAPRGPVSEETNLVALADGALYATYRTIDGYPCAALSRDRGATWTAPSYMTYQPGGARRIKNPRAANFVKKFSNGKYLYWFHNHGGEPSQDDPAWDPYQGRNPAWVCGGVERDGSIAWSEPEILLYDDDPKVRMSYPDFIEDGGRIYVTETQKTVARVHPIEPSLLDAVWGQHDRAEVSREGIALEVEGAPIAPGATRPRPSLAPLSQRRGFSIEAWVWLDELTAGQVLIDGRDASGRGFALVTSKRGALELTLSDGAHQAAWESDSGTHDGTLKIGAWQHVVATVDAGPRVIWFAIDGTLNDGGATREYGWGRFGADLDVVAPTPPSGNVTLAPRLLGRLERVRIYDRPLRVSEAVGNHRAGRD
jgi:hypothetical protein